MNKGNRRFGSLDDLSESAAEYIFDIGRKKINENGRFSLVLSGGSTPKRLYSLLTEPIWRNAINWNCVHLFWGDERFVPPDHPDSNYDMVNESLLSHISIPAANIHRIKGEASTPSEAAEDYERELRMFFGTGDSRHSATPSFDLILLGMGNDGHTASLFPGDSALGETTKLACEAHAPAGVEPNKRITLTLPTLNEAERVVFLVAGSGKREIAGQAYNGGTGSEKYPSSLIQPKLELLWFVDFDL